MEQGQQVVQALGLQNLYLHAMSLTDITPDFGQFGYIIAHGVFSWVPPEVREAMMRIMRDNLSPTRWNPRLMEAWPQRATETLRPWSPVSPTFWNSVKTRPLA